MSTTTDKPPHAAHTIALAISTVITAPVVVARILCSARLIDLDKGPTNAALSIAAVVLVAVTLGIGWRRTVVRTRAEHAEWNAARARREEVLLDGDEDRDLWDSVQPKTPDEDTCAFGLNVVAINQYRDFPRAG